MHLIRNQQFLIQDLFVVDDVVGDDRHCRHGGHVDDSCRRRWDLPTTNFQVLNHGDIHHVNDNKRYHLTIVSYMFLLFLLPYLDLL